MKLYIAGPEVFLPDAQEMLARKNELAVAAGFEPVGPHGEFQPDAASASGDSIGIGISRLNEELMDLADVCIANLTPFRGISADPGTVFEVGFMLGRGKAVFGYTNEPANYFERVSAAIPVRRDPDTGMTLDADGRFVEEHGMADNLMIDGGLLSRGYALVTPASPVTDPLRDLEGYRECLRLARALA